MHAKAKSSLPDRAFLLTRLRIKTMKLRHNRTRDSPLTNERDKSTGERENAIIALPTSRGKRHIIALTACVIPRGSCMRLVIIVYMSSSRQTDS